MPLVAVCTPWLAGEGETLLQAIRRHPDCPPTFRQTAHVRLADDGAA